MAGPDPVTSKTYDDIGIDAYIDYDEAKKQSLERADTTSSLINKTSQSDSIKSLQSASIENIVGSPLLTKRYSQIAAPKEYSTQNLNLFHHSILIKGLSREKLLDVDVERIQASKLNDSDKKKVVKMLKTLENLAKLQENVYFETMRYNKG